MYLQVRLSKIAQIYPVDKLFGIKRSLLFAFRVNVVPCSRLRQKRQRPAWHCGCGGCSPASTYQTQIIQLLRQQACLGKNMRASTDAHLVHHVYHAFVWRCSCRRTNVISNRKQCTSTTTLHASSNFVSIFYRVPSPVSSHSELCLNLPRWSLRCTSPPCRVSSKLVMHKAFIYPV